MSETRRVFARDTIKSVADNTGLSEVFVAQVIKNLKGRGLVASARPIAPPVTPRDIARIILGLADPLSSRAPDIVADLGRLPLAAGAGEATAEGELVSLIEEAAGWRSSNVDFRKGQVVVSATAELVDVHCELFDGEPARTSYREGKSLATAHRFITVPIPSLARIARDLLNSKV